MKVLISRTIWRRAGFMAGMLAAYSIVRSVNAADSNVYFQLYPRDAIPDTPAIEWVIGGTNNYVDVRMRTGPDITITIKGMELRYRDPDHTTNGFVIRNAFLPNDSSGIFYGKDMLVLELNTNNNGLSQLLVNIGESSVPASNFINTYGLVATWQLELAPWLTNSFNVSNAGRLVGTSTKILVSSLSFPSGTYPTNLNVYEISPLFNQVNWVPEPTTVVLLGVGVLTLALRRRRGLR